MSGNDVTAILSELAALRGDVAAMKLEHGEDMAAIGSRIDVLTEAHRTCAGHCWVANQEQIKAALRKSSAALLAIPESDVPR